MTGGNHAFSVRRQIAYNSPSMTVAVRSFAKINFELYIGAARADGYHDLRRCTRRAEDFSPDTPASSRGPGEIRRTAIPVGILLASRRERSGAGGRHLLAKST